MRWLRLLTEKIVQKFVCCARLKEDKYYRYSIVIVRINEITLFGRSN